MCVCVCTCVCVCVCVRACVYLVVLFSFLCRRSLMLTTSRCLLLLIISFTRPTYAPWSSCKTKEDAETHTHTTHIRSIYIISRRVIMCVHKMSLFATSFRCGGLDLHVIFLRYTHTHVLYPAEHSCLTSYTIEKKGVGYENKCFADRR